MLISSFLSCALLLVQGAICSDIQQDTTSVTENTPKQISVDSSTDTYGYHHPPVPEVNEETGSRKEKSINFNEKPIINRGIRRRGRPRPSTPSSEIPVQVIYDPESTTTTAPTPSPLSLDVTTKLPTTRYARRRPPQINKDKVIAIKETSVATSNTVKGNVAEDEPTSVAKDESSVSTTEIPKKSKGKFINKKTRVSQTTEATSTTATEKVSENVENVPTSTENNISYASTTEISKISRGRYPNRNKKINIKQTTPVISNIAIENVTADVPTLTKEDTSYVSTTEASKRFKGRYPNRNKMITIIETTPSTSNIAIENIAKDVSTSENVTKDIPTSENVTDVPKVAEGDKNYVSTTENSKKSRGRYSGRNKKNDRTQTTSATSNIASDNVTEDVLTFTKEDKSFVSTTEASPRFRGRLLNKNKKIDIRETTTLTSNIATEDNTGGLSTFTEKDTSGSISPDMPKRWRGSYSNSNKKIVIRQTTAATSNIDTENVTGDATTTKKVNNHASTTKFPKRSRASYFKKRTEGPAPRVKILEEKNFVYSHSGNFHYSFLGGDGTKVSSVGSLKSYENNKTGEAVSGSVFYKDKDGNDYSLSYTADENGYRPTGAHLPTPPPLPPAIARALKYIADKTTSSPPIESE